MCGRERHICSSAALCMCVRTCEVMRPLPSLSIARNVAFASDLSLKGKPSFFAALDNSCEGVGQSREEEGVRVRVY